MSEEIIHTLDLNFLGSPGAIAAYLIPHRNGVVLVESGPGSTQRYLQAALSKLGYSLSDISDVFLTHIHLDHAGAAGWLSQQGARIHVHSVGAPHLLNPEKLLSSARRIYGEQMDTLWGDFLPVVPDRLSILEDHQVVEVDGIEIQAIDTPGHADHHFVYMYRSTCFTGDIGGVRLAGFRHLRLPMPPPEFHLEKWRNSLDRVSQLNFSRIAPTHFGIHSDPEWHLARLRKLLNDIEAWLESIMPTDPTADEINTQFMQWVLTKTQEDGLTLEQAQGYELANPSWMSGYGMQRYWKKFRVQA